MSESAVADRIRIEVARRLDAMLNTPDVVARYDRNGDGKLDPDERDIMRYIVEAEVVRELDDQPTTQDPSAPEARPHKKAVRHEWSVEDEVEDLPVIEVVDERYELLKELGSGSQGNTYLARDRESGDHVAIKEMVFARVQSWKSLELFEREAKVLRQLDHPAIPKFIDSFRLEETEGQPRFFLVQEFVPGEGLDVIIARGDTMPIRELEKFARALLRVLEYLHGLNPPVVHRDLKPSNIVWHAGRFSLVDFGAVQLANRGEEGGSTVVGTSGFMPPEQLSGRATPQSDLYALGATLIHLLTHEHPSRLPTRRLALDWRSLAGNLPTPFADFVDRLVAPALEDRFASATSAIAALDAMHGLLPLATRPAPSKVIQRPPDADARLLWSGDDLVVDMSHSSLAPRLICSSIGLAVGIFLAIKLLYWPYAVIGLLVGLVVAQFWAGGPNERLQMMRGGKFHHMFAHGKVRRELSGSVHRLRLEGSELFLQTETGAQIAVGQHCSPQTRRWIFGTLDHYLRS